LRTSSKRPGLAAGLHLFHKPPGPTSHDLLKALRASDGHGSEPLPVGHGGTLDSFARGLLLVLVGPATKLFEHLHDVPKTYVADLAWGRATDTDHAQGRTIATGDAGTLTPELLENSLVSRRGWLDQVPPEYSAKHVDGERASERAARGEVVSLEPVKVFVHETRWLSHKLPRSSTLFVSVRGGFYVRAFARDLGAAVGVPAHLTNLKRTAIGPWRDPGPEKSIHVAGRGLLPWLPSVVLSDAEWKAIAGGGSIEARDVTTPEWPLPQGFPVGPRTVRAFRNEKLVALLSEEAGRFTSVVRLGEGV